MFKKLISLFLILLFVLNFNFDMSSLLIRAVNDSYKHIEVLKDINWEITKNSPSARTNKDYAKYENELKNNTKSTKAGTTTYIRSVDQLKFITMEINNLNNKYSEANLVLDFPDKIVDLGCNTNEIILEKEFINEKEFNLKVKGNITKSWKPIGDGAVFDFGPPKEPINPLPGGSKPTIPDPPPAPTENYEPWRPLPSGDYGSKSEGSEPPEAIPWEPYSSNKSTRDASNYAFATFKGKFDGNGHTIKNMLVCADDSNDFYGIGNVYAGFFGHAEGPDVEIKNLTIADSVVIAKTDAELDMATGNGACYAGGIAGKIDRNTSGNFNNLNCKNCKIISSCDISKSNNSRAGGIAGALIASNGRYDEQNFTKCDLTIENMNSENTNVMCTGKSGGMFGTFGGYYEKPDKSYLGSASAKITAQHLQVKQCNINSADQAGGIVGGFVCLENFVAKDTYSNANIIQAANQAGGITGGFGCGCKAFTGISGRGELTGNVDIQFCNSDADVIKAIKNNYGGITGGFGCNGVVYFNRCCANNLVDNFPSITNGFGCKLDIDITECTSDNAMINDGFGCTGHINISNCLSKSGSLFINGFGSQNGNINLSNLKAKYKIIEKTGFGCNAEVNISNCDSEIGSLFSTGIGCHGNFTLTNSKSKNGIFENGGIGCGGEINISNCESTDGNLLGSMGIGCSKNIILNNLKTKTALTNESIGCAEGINISDCESTDGSLLNKGIGCYKDIILNNLKVKNTICNSIGASGNLNVCNCESTDGSLFIGSLGFNQNITLTNLKAKNKILENGSISTGVGNLKISNCEVLGGNFFDKLSINGDVVLNDSKSKDKIAEKLSCLGSLIVSDCEFSDGLFTECNIGGEKVEINDCDVGYLFRRIGCKKISLNRINSHGKNMSKIENTWNATNGYNLDYSGMIGSIGTEEIIMNDCHHVGDLDLKEIVLAGGPSAEEVKSNFKLGGLIGALGAKKAVFTNCSHDGNIFCEGKSAGLIVSAGAEDFEIKNCRVTGNINGKDLSSGFICEEGNGGNLNIDNCYFEGNVNSESNIAAGLICQGDHLNLSNCHANGQIKGCKIVASLIGESTGVNLNKCYSISNITAANSDENSKVCAGGLIGKERSRKWGFNNGLPKNPIPNRPGEFYDNPDDPKSWNGICHVKTSINVNDCYFIGDMGIEISPTIASSSGGLIGSIESIHCKTDIKNIYTACKIGEFGFSDENSHRGGIIGYCGREPNIKNFYAYNIDKSVSLEAVANFPEFSKESSKLNTIEMTGISPNVFDDLEKRAPLKMLFTTLAEKWLYVEDKYIKSAREHYYDRYCNYPILKNTNENPSEIIYEKYKDIDLQDLETKVWVISEGPYPLDSKLYVNAMDTDEELKTVGHLWDDVHELKARHSSFYDIHLEHENGQIFQPIAPVTIRIPLPEHFDKAKLESFRLEGGPDKTFDEKIVKIDGTEYVEFVTDHFSYYGISDESGQNNSGGDNNTNNPKTNSRLPILPIVILSSCNLLLIYLFVIKRRKKIKNKKV